MQIHDFIKHKGAASFDRSIYLTLYNGEDDMCHSTKSTDIRLKNPRLSIFGAAHPTRMINRLNKERNIDEGSDGLYARFLVFTPKPIRKRIGKGNYFHLKN